MSGDIALQIDLFIRLLIAAVLGATIGIERESRDQPAGIRTHMLVSVGSATFTVLSIFAFAGPGGDQVAWPHRSCRGSASWVPARSSSTVPMSAA